MDFDKLTSSHIFIFIGIAAIILEIILGAVTGFELFVFGIAAIIAGGFGLLTGSFNVTLVVFTILIVIYLLWLRKYIKTKLIVDTVNTSVDRIIGEKAKVIKEITPSKPGQIKIDDEVWRARAHKVIKVGETVTVKSVSGVTVMVEND